MCVNAVGIPWFSCPVWVGLRVVGGDGGEGPPGPIPNPVAKLPSADGTALARVWESKTPPTHSLQEGWGEQVFCSSHPFFCDARKDSGTLFRGCSGVVGGGGFHENFPPPLTHWNASTVWFSG